MIAVRLWNQHNPDIDQPEKKMADLILTPLTATIIFVLVCLSGYQYRRVWKAEGPRYQYWVFGILAALGLCILGFVPLKVDG
jgi:hypothetical protein